MMEIAFELFMRESKQVLHCSCFRCPHSRTKVGHGLRGLHLFHPFSVTLISSRNPTTWVWWNSPFLPYPLPSCRCYVFAAPTRQQQQPVAMWIMCKNVPWFWPRCPMELSHGVHIHYIEIWYDLFPAAQKQPCIHLSSASLEQLLQLETNSESNKNALDLKGLSVTDQIKLNL